MKPTQIAPLLATLVLSVAGCKTQPEEPPPPVTPTAAQIESMRQTYQQIRPGARVGVVSAVLTDTDMLMIKDMDTDGLKAGEVILIVNVDQESIASGTVTEITDGQIALRFQPTTRRPVVGDAAVRF